MKILLDSHTVIWAADDPAKLTSQRAETSSHSGSARRTACFGSFRAGADFYGQRAYRRCKMMFGERPVENAHPGGEAVERIVVHSRVGADGVLRLNVPIGAAASKRPNRRSVNAKSYPTTTNRRSNDDHSSRF